MNELSCDVFPIEIKVETSRDHARFGDVIFEGPAGPLQLPPSLGSFWKPSATQDALRSL